MRNLSAMMIALTLLAAASFAPADTYPRQPGVDVQQYVFRLTLRDDTDTIEGVTTVDLVFVAAGVTELLLDLIGTRGDDITGMTVTGVWIAGAIAAGPATSARLPVADRGTQAPFEHAGDRLRIQLGTPSKIGQRAFIAVAYHGVEPGSTMLSGAATPSPAPLLPCLVDLGSVTPGGSALMIGSEGALMEDWVDSAGCAGRCGAG